MGLGRLLPPPKLIQTRGLNHSLVLPKMKPFRGKSQPHLLPPINTKTPAHNTVFTLKLPPLAPMRPNASTLSTGHS